MPNPLNQEAPPPTPSIPIEVIRAAVRAEMTAAHHLLGQAAVQAASQATVQTNAALMRAAFHAIGVVLAIRKILTLATAGAFVLAVMALRVGTYQATAVLVGYALLVLIPLIALERSPRIGPPPPEM